MTSKEEDNIQFIAKKEDTFTISKKLLDKYPNALSAFAKFNKANEIEIECPYYIFKFIIQLFETDKCDLDLLQKLNYKNELIEWCQLYCLNNFMPYINGYSNQLNDIPLEYLKLYQEEFNFRKYYKKEDNLLIKIYTKYYNESSIPSIDDSLFNSDKSFNIQISRWDRNTKIDTFYYKDYKKDLKCFVDKQTFENRFHHNSYNLFLNFSDELWKNIIIAGGFISDCINPRKKKNYWEREPNISTNDIDIFIYELNEKECENKIKLLIKTIYSYFSNDLDNTKYNPTVIWRTKDTISIAIRHGYKRCIIQIIYSRLYTSISEILLGFDIDSCCCAFNGTDVLILPKTEFAYKHCVNIAGIDTTRFSNSYTNRLIKYNNEKGFGIYVPGFRQELMKNLDSINSKELDGFAKIYKLYYNKKINLKYNIDDQTNQNNYEHIKIPKNYALNFLENICIINKPKNMKVFPFVFIKTNTIKSSEIDNLSCKIIDFRNIYNMKAINKVKFDTFRKKNKLHFDLTDNSQYFENKDTSNNTYEKFKEITTTYCMNKEDPNEDLIYQFQYNSQDWNDKNYYNKISTNVKPYLEFKKNNPGKQIIAGNNPLYLHKDNLNFFAQAYENNCCYANLDISKMN